MTSTIDAIAYAIEGLPTSDVDECKEAALAILETLKARIPDLVWEKLGDRHYRVMMTDKMSWRCESYADGGWFLTYSVPGYCESLIQGLWGTPEEAKAAANTHNKAQAIKLMGWEQ